MGWGERPNLAIQTRNMGLQDDRGVHVVAAVAHLDAERCFCRRDDKVPFVTRGCTATSPRVACDRCGRHFLHIRMRQNNPKLPEIITACCVREIMDVPEIAELTRAAPGR